MEWDNGLIKLFTTCEFSHKCKWECPGKNDERECAFSCGLRRSLLLCQNIEEEEE